MDAFVELTERLVGVDYDVADFLHLLCERTHDALEVDAVGVVLAAGGGELQLSAASTEESGAVELFEMQRQQGPCYDAYATGEQVVARDIAAAAPRWPQFVERALQEGFAAVYAFPLRLGDDRLGAMNVFWRQRHTFADADIEVSQSLADVATIALINQRSIRAAEDRAAHLQAALHSRVLIEQAKGALAERAGVGVAEAFTRLRHHARRHRLKLHDVCRQVLDEGLTPGEPTGR